MIKEVLYYFIPSESATNLIDKLSRLEDGGRYIGFTYPAGSTHTCFNSDQESKLKQVLDCYIESGLRYERGEYFAGNLSGDDFGISTFRQPITQWCPALIMSADHKNVFKDGEPWGLTMDGLIALPVKLRDIIQRQVLGLDLIEKDRTLYQFDLYRIQSCHPAGLSARDYSKTPLALGGNMIPTSLDIWKYRNGIILCSQRFGKLLNNFWDGFPDVKFQPVICSDFSNQLTAELCTSISLASIPNNTLENIRRLEMILEVNFPQKYLDFLMQHPVSLPMGWLKIDDGPDSMIIKVMKEEQQNAEISMPEDLIPIYAYGTGNYVCLQRNSDDLGATFVEWFHEDGAILELAEEEFEGLYLD